MLLDKLPYLKGSTFPSAAAFFHLECSCNFKNMFVRNSRINFIQILQKIEPNIDFLNIDETILIFVSNHQISKGITIPKNVPYK